MVFLLGVSMASNTIFAERGFRKDASSPWLALPPFVDGSCPPFRSAGEQEQAGRVLARDERFTAAHHEVRAQMDQAEAAFSAALTRLMAERQLTQAELAERIGVGQSAIAMLLKRRCRPQRRTLGKLAEALSVPVDELWPGFNAGWRSGVM
jgi:DNA-binding XRE family transcriptional regulator